MGPVGRVELRSDGVRVAVLSRGGIVQDWRVPLAGAEVPVVLGLADPAAYRGPCDYMGAIVGRVANRIGGASYRQGGRRILLPANDGAHQLHGGPEGLWSVPFRIDRDGDSGLILSHVSPAGAGGFPGRVEFEIAMRLDGFRLTWDMRATPDEETPISLAQHNYYALAPNLADHRLHLPARQRLERDAEGIMTGRILPDTRLRAGLVLPSGPLHPDTLDDFFVFDPARDPMAPVARVQAASGLTLRMWSDQPGAQVYTGQSMAAMPGGHEGREPGPCAGFCIEPSGYPNALNIPGFPSILYSPDRPYRQVLSVEIAPQGTSVPSAAV